MGPQPENADLRWFFADNSKTTHDKPTNLYIFEIIIKILRRLVHYMIIFDHFEIFLILGTCCRQNAESQFPVFKNRWNFFRWSFALIATRNHLYQIDLRKSSFFGHTSVQSGTKLHTWRTILYTFFREFDTFRVWYHCWWLVCFAFLFLVILFHCLSNNIKRVWGI